MRIWNPSKENPLVKYFFIFLIRIYQWTLGPFTGGQCRFYPSCSEYGIEAFKKYGACKGSYLTVKRICKCNPWHSGGVDPLP
ncbi:MAG: membrane protein insertion efficiency factor YidD [Simkaniaceae bacterium]|nr:membrane protein insertion efficiency factor YidD [Chlamydiia bacterium]